MGRKEEETVTGGDGAPRTPPIVTVVLYPEALGVGWGCSRVGGSGPGPERKPGWAGPPAPRISTDLRG